MVPQRPLSHFLSPPPHAGSPTETMNALQQAAEDPQVNREAIRRVSPRPVTIGVCTFGVCTRWWCAGLCNVPPRSANTDLVYFPNALRQIQDGRFRRQTRRHLCHHRHALRYGDHAGTVCYPNRTGRPRQWHRPNREQHADHHYRRPGCRFIISACQVFLEVSATYRTSISPSPWAWCCFVFFAGPTLYLLNLIPSASCTTSTTIYHDGQIIILGS